MSVETIQRSVRKERIAQPETAEKPSALSRVFEKRNLMRAGLPHDHIRPALLIDGGGIKGAFGAGFLLGLADMGLTEAFSVVIGDSSGAAAAAYFTSGKAALGGEIYTEDLASTKFANPWNMVHPGRPSRIMDFDYLNGVLRGERGIDVERIRSSQTDTYVGVTTPEGKGEVISLKEDGLDPVLAVLASCAHPIAYRKMILLNRPTISDIPLPYVDGEIGNGMPVDFAIEQGATDIIALLNIPCPDPSKVSLKAPRAERLIVNQMMQGCSVDLRERTLDRRERFYEPLARTYPGVNLDIVAPDRNHVGLVTTNAKKIRKAIEIGYQTLKDGVIFERTARPRLA